MSKVMGIYAKFYHDHSLNMVMSRDPGYKFLFFPDSVSGFWGFIDFGEIGSGTKKLQAEKKTLGGGTPPCLWVSVCGLSVLRCGQVVWSIESM